MALLFSTAAGIPAAAAGDELKARSKFDDPDAKALALRVHREAAACDKLPQFSYCVQTGNCDVASMLSMQECSLSWLKQALDEPTNRDRWFESGETLAWSGKQALWSNYDRTYKNETQEANQDKYRQDCVWSAEGAFGRSEAEDHPPSFVLVPNSRRIWERCLTNLAFFRATPHRFWWGTSSDHNDSVSLIPPEKASYRFADREIFDGELCDVVESPTRAERLWISRQSRRLRGVLAFRFRGRQPPVPFYKTRFVEKMAGRPIDSQKEYSDWVSTLSDEQRIDLSIAWTEGNFDSFGPNELIRFRDYREVAPGVWIPFREDRAFTHGAEGDGNRYKYIHLWLAVQEIRTDVDLTETIAKLQPRDGDKVQDQRFGVVLNYKFSPDRTQRELQEMADAERQKPGFIQSPAKEKAVEKAIRQIGPSPKRK